MTHVLTRIICVSSKRKDLDVRGLVGVDDLEGVDDIDRV